MPKTRLRRRRGVLCGLLFALASLAGCENNEPLSSRPAFRVPQDYPTIQAAVDAAVPGGIVLVSPGVYTDVTLRAYQSREFPNGALSAIHMRSDVHVQGTGGLGGVVVRDTSNATINYGAMLVDVNDNSVLENIVFESFQIGVAVVGSTGNVVSCRVTDSDAGIWIFKCAGEPWAVGNFVENCRFDGILTQVSDPLIWQNIVRNCAAGVGAELSGNPFIIDNILCSNQVGFGTNTGSTAFLQYNAIFNNSIAGVLTADGAAPVVVENDIYDNPDDFWVAQYESALQDSIFGQANYWRSVDIESIATTQIRDLRTDPTSGGYVDFLPVSPGSVFRLNINPQAACVLSTAALHRTWLAAGRFVDTARMGHTRATIGPAN